MASAVLVALMAASLGLAGVFILPPASAAECTGAQSGDSCVGVCSGYDRCTGICNGNNVACSGVCLDSSTECRNGAGDYCIPRNDFTPKLCAPVTTG